MPKVDTPGVAKLLREYAQRTALRGGNPYRSKAYSRAADSLAALPVALDRLIAEDRLTEIPGIGDAIADIITKLYRTGTHPSLEKLRKEIPAGVLELLTVPGLRPDKVLRLYKDLGIASLAELEAAAKDDRIKKAKGLGGALQTKILQNLAITKSGEARLHLHRAAALMEHAKHTLEKAQPDLRRITIAGDFRRGCELVADLALVAEAPSLDDGPAVLDSSGLKVYLTDRKHFGATLLHATGSAAHLEELRALAERKGMRLDLGGLHDGRKSVAAAEEDIVLRFLSLNRNYAKARAKSIVRSRANSRSLSPTQISAASCIAIPTRPTAPRRWRAWPWPRANAAFSISGSLTTRSRRTTPGAFRSRKSNSSNAKPTGSISRSERASGFSRVLNPTSWPTARSIIRPKSSPASISSSPASIAASKWTESLRQTGFFARYRTLTQRSLAT